VRIPTFSRHSSTDTADDERPTMVTGTPAGQRGETVAPPSDATTTLWFDNNRAGRAARDTTDARAAADPPEAERDTADRDSDETTAELRPRDMRDPEMRRDMDDPTTRRRDALRTDQTPVATGPKPRASLLATLGLIGGVAAALLVLSGPLLPYGIGLAVLALILSVSGMHATGRRHVAGKTDALIGMVLSLAAIVVGVLALTGSLSWLGTDMQPIPTLRQWLDAHTVNRF
jgi:hypothetical protein